MNQFQNQDAGKGNSRMLEDEQLISTLTKILRRWIEF